MGLSFRKSISFGPMRVNLSTSGVSYSVGVRGARVGVGKRGTYVSLGAGGIQYRKYIHSNSKQGGAYRPQRPEQYVEALTHTITSDDINQISDVDSQDFINELTQKSAKIAFAKWGTILLVVLLGCGLLGYFSQVARVEKSVLTKVEITAANGLKIRQRPDKQSEAVGSAVQGAMLPLADSTIKDWYAVGDGYIFKKYSRIAHVPVTKEFTRLEEHPEAFKVAAVICFLVVLAAFIYFLKVDRRRMVLEINYEFSDDMAKVHNDFMQAFNGILSSQKVWQYLHSEHVDDKRRHAGASSSITRIALGGVAINRKPTSHLKTNVSIPYLGLKNTELFFFPERLVIKRNNAFASVFYKNLSLTAENTRFIESQTLPSDATVVDKTWKYQNKNGSPDQRFRDNRQIPVCRYSEYTFKSGTGIHEVITTSRVASFDLFAKYVHALGELQRRMSIS